MAEFMVEFDLPVPFTETFVERIPEQRMMVDEFMNAGKIISFALSEDRSRLWMVLHADNDFEVLDIINEFPLIEEMPYTITELMFNHAGAFKVPAFSLN